MNVGLRGLLSVILVCLVLRAEPLSSEPIRLAPGDDKTGYEGRDYQTNSLSLENRRGQKANLLHIATKQHLGLPNPVDSFEVTPDLKQIELGRKLFFDRRLSRNKTMSCAMCHIPEQGFTSNELKRPTGFEGRKVKRNAPSLLNIRLYTNFFVDARETTLAQQVWSPLLAANEMNNPSVGYVVAQIRGDIDYKRLFNRAFNEAPNMMNIGMALAQYQQSLMAANSAFDQWKYGAQINALSEEQQFGFELFTGKARCAVCHHINDRYALFTDQQLHNTGVGYRFSMLETADEVAVTLAPGTKVSVNASIIRQVGETKANDLGRYEVTLNPDDRWRYRTPSLRNVALTAPYMHNGEFLTLMSVIEFYDRGGEPHAQQSPLIQPLGLSDDEKAALELFIHALTSEEVSVLVADAFAGHVSDP